MSVPKLGSLATVLLAAVTFLSCSEAPQESTTRMIEPLGSVTPTDGDLWLCKEGTDAHFTVTWDYQGASGSTEHVIRDGNCELVHWWSEGSEIPVTVTELLDQLPDGFTLDRIEITDASGAVQTVTGTNSVTGFFAGYVITFFNVNQAFGRITGGGGWIGMVGTDGEDVHVTHGFTLHCDIELSNNLEINWAGNRWHIEKEFFEAGYPICTDDPTISPEPPPAPFDTFEGRTVGKLNGVDGSPIRFVLQDAGEPGGKNDRGWMMIWAVGADPEIDPPILTVEPDFLVHGNLQFHYDQPHGCNVNKC